jgi:hypothetical protein
MGASNGQGAAPDAWTPSAGDQAYPTEVLRLLGISQPVHPNQASRLFWRYCQDNHLIRGR